MRLPDALHARINSDGERHPLENTLAFACVGFGLLALGALTAHWYDAAAYLSLTGAAVAGYDEFIAKTRGERWIILAGFALCVVTLTLAMASGAIF